MIVFAVLMVIIFTIIACVGLVCAHYDADDLRNMGIRL
jgi:hypothetical protein